MNVICFHDDAFYALIEEVVKRLKDELQKEKSKERWINTDEAMRMLRVTSSTTMQKYRDEGKIRFSQPSRKIILYDRFSIEEYIERNVRETL